MRAFRWVGTWLGCCLLIWNVQAGCVLVCIVGGDDLFTQSDWVQKNITQGVSGWLIGDPLTEPFQSDGWQPEIVWDEPERAPITKQILIERHADYAYGIRTQVETFASLLRHEKLEWQVIFLRDVERARNYAPLCTSEQAGLLSKRSWAHIDSLLKAISSKLSPQRDLVIVTATPLNGTNILERRLTPIYMMGRSAGTGLLQDASTRLPGFGQRVSLVPTVRHHLMLSPANTRQGAVLKGQGKPPSVPGLAAMRNERVRRAEARRVGTWLPWMWLLLIATGAWIFERQKNLRLPPKPMPAARPGVISREMLLKKRPRADAAAPAEPEQDLTHRRQIHAADFAIWGVALSLSSLLPAAFSPQSAVITFVVMIVSAGLFVWFARFLDSPLIGAGVMCGLGLMMLLLDSFSGGNWSRNGMLSYNLLLDNRFYGVGNGYAALATGWALLFLACWLQIQGLPLTGVLLLGILSLWLGWKSANFGATLAVLGTSVIYAGMMFYPKIKKGKVKGWIWAVLFGLMLISLWLLWQGTPHLQAFLQEPSHNLLLRKLQMNWEQILFSRWGLLLILSLWAAWRVRKLVTLDPQSKLLERAWLTAGILMLLLNDSGVLMTACLAFLYWSWLSMLYWQEASLHQQAITRRTL